jgi:hypothetical protein
MEPLVHLLAASVDTLAHRFDRIKPGTIETGLRKADQAGIEHARGERLEEPSPFPARRLVPVAENVCRCVRPARCSGKSVAEMAKRREFLPYLTLMWHQTK